MSKEIKLLDGQLFEYSELLEKMQYDDFYYGYLNRAALSSSSLKKLLQSPKAYQSSLEESQDETKALREGKLIHLLLLEPHKEETLQVIDVKSRTAKAYKDAAIEFGSENTYTAVEIAVAKKVVRAVKDCPEAWDMIYGAATEVPAVGNIMGYPFRAKADILHKGTRIVDLKTTADIHKFKWNAYSFGYDAQAAIYTHLFGLKEFTFLVVDKSSYDVGIFTTTPEFINGGKEKVAKAIGIYREYFQEGKPISSYIIRGEL
jgi:hypothetical protein